MLKLGQFNGFAACINSTIQMLNNIWNGLVNDVENTKRRFDELEAASTVTNEHLNDGLLAVIESVYKLETKGCSLCALYDGMQTLVNAQECKIWDLDNKVNFYSQLLVSWRARRPNESRMASTPWNNASRVRMTRLRSCFIVLLWPKKVIVAVRRVLLR